MSHKYLSEKLNLPRFFSELISKFLWPRMMVGTCIFPGIFSKNYFILKSNDEINITGETQTEFKKLAPKVKKKLSKIFFKLGAILKIKKLFMTPGEDIHYAGTIPMKMIRNTLV